MSRAWLIAGAIASLNLVPLACAAEDVLLKAMRDELQRSMTLEFNALDKPYYIEYSVEDGHRVQVTAMLGGIVTAEQGDIRVPRVQVRVGSPQFDNTNYVGSRTGYAGRSGASFPLDNDYAALRRAFWLATDASYKSALEAISRKRSALKNVSVTEELADFSAAKQAVLLQDVTSSRIDLQFWTTRLKELSSAFLKFPQLLGSTIEYQALDGARRMVTSEGGELRLPERESEIKLRTSAQCKDGMTLRDAVIFESLDPNGLPTNGELLQAIQELGTTVTAMTSAPRADDYSGPVLFEGRAAAQIFAELLGHNLALARKPVLDPGGPGGIAASELEGRAGSRILPDTFSVVDDPTLKEWKGQRLFGTMQIDEDGVETKPLTLVENGVLKNYLLTRQPVRGSPVDKWPGAVAG